MSASLKISEQGLFLYQSGGEHPIMIIDFNDFFGNLGAVSLHSLDSKNTGTIPAIIRNIAAEYNEKAPYMENPPEVVSVMLTACFLIKQSMSRYKPRNILEIGCKNGSLSYFITKTALAIQPDSRVFCLSEVFCGQVFMKILSELGDVAANLSLLTTGQEAEILRDNYFDFVVINGGEFMKNPADVIANAVRVAQTGGVLLCLTQGQHLLHNCFAACVDGYGEYFIADDSSVLVKVIDNKDKEALQDSAVNHLYAEMRNLDCDVCRVLDDVNAAAPAELEAAARKLSRMENIAIELFAELEDIELKYVLNCTKGTLLDYIYTSDVGYREKCARQLHDFAADREKYRYTIIGRN